MTRRPARRIVRRCKTPSFDAERQGTSRIGVAGIGIGGLWRGESADAFGLRRVVPELALTCLATEGGAGTPRVLAAIAAGGHVFVVWPTRLARHGGLLGGGLQPLCVCTRTTNVRSVPKAGLSGLRRYTRSYLRHLLRVGELTAKSFLYPKPHYAPD